MARQIRRSAGFSRGVALGVAAALLVSRAAYGQTAIDLRTQVRNVDFSGAASTRPVKTGVVLPAGCSPGEMFFKTDAAAGSNLYGCPVDNTWVAMPSASLTPNYSLAFAGQTTVSLAHSLNTTTVLVQCFDAAAAVIEPDTVVVTSANAVSVHFAAPQTGMCVVNGSGAGGGGGSGVPGGLPGEMQYNNGGSFGGLVVGPGLTSDGASLKVDPLAVRTYLSGSASLTHGTIGAGACASQTMAVPGAQVGDRVAAGPPAEIFTYNLDWKAGVTAQNTVTVRLCNWTGAAIMPTAGITWNIDIARSF